MIPVWVWLLLVPIGIWAIVSILFIGAINQMMHGTLEPANDQKAAARLRQAFDENIVTEDWIESIGLQPIAFTKPLTCLGWIP